MRLWSIHPVYLDWKGLGANWMEALLAQAVVQGKTKGWRNHPQLNRFKEMEQEWSSQWLPFIEKVEEDEGINRYDYYEEGY